MKFIILVSNLKETSPSVFSIYNQGNSSVVNNMQYNLFTIFPLSCPFAEFGFVFIDFIAYFRFYDAILLSKYDSAEKKIPNYAYVLKNGVGRYNIFFFIFTQSLLDPPFCVVFM
jgi:hypothetical protein